MSPCVMIIQSPFHLYHQVITDTHLVVGVILVMLPDILIYLALLPPEIALTDIVVEQNEEEPYIINVCTLCTHCSTCL